MAKGARRYTYQMTITEEMHEKIEKVGQLWPTVSIAALLRPPLDNALDMLIEAGEHVHAGRTDQLDNVFALFAGRSILELSKLSAPQTTPKEVKGSKKKARS